MNYIRSLDGLRALAIIGVMLYHYELVACGWVGVQLFFVLSGFLITGILLSSKEKYSFKTYVKRFYWRRSLRIFPLYFTYLAVVSAVIYFVPKYYDLKPLLGYLFTYTYNFSRLSEAYEFSFFFTHFWSLCIEEQFYLIWPFLIFFLSKTQLKKAIVLIIVLAPAIRYFLGSILTGTYQDKEVADFIYWFPLSQFDAFAIGAALVLYGDDIGRYRVYFLPVSAVLLLLCGMFNLNSLYQDWSWHNISSMGYPLKSLKNYQHVWAYTLINIFFGSLIAFVLALQDATRSGFKKILETPFMITTGRVSYGMYVFHWAIMIVFHKLVTPYMPIPFAGFVVYLFLVIGFSWLSFHYYESYFLRLKNVKI